MLRPYNIPELDEPGIRGRTLADGTGSDLRVATESSRYPANWAVISLGYEGLGPTLRGVLSRIGLRGHRGRHRELLSTEGTYVSCERTQAPLSGLQPKRNVSPKRSPVWRRT